MEYNWAFLHSIYPTKIVLATHTHTHTVVEAQQMLILAQIRLNQCIPMVQRSAVPIALVVAN